MQYSGSWLAWRLALALCICCLLALLWITPSAIGLEQSNSPRPIEQLEQRLQTIAAYTLQLEQELRSSQLNLSEQEQLVELLKSELAELRRQLEDSRKSEENLQGRIGELLSLLDESEKRLEELSECLSNYDWTAKELVSGLREERDREAVRARFWRTISSWGIPAAFAAGILGGFLISR